jgi:putative hydrolase of the HAD superfamily
MIRAILFDADNTLYHTKAVAAEADKAAIEVIAADAGKTVDEVYELFLATVETVKRSTNPEERTRRYSYTVLAQQLGVSDVETAHGVFVQTLMNSIELVKGVWDFLEQVQDKKLAVFTEDSKELAIGKLHRLGILDRFAAVITSDDVGVMKPSPEYFEKAVTALGVQPADCLVIGDDFEKDLKDAKEAGAKVTLINGKDGQADFCFTEYSELNGWLGTQ